jgi:SH3-like domain-containing protein
VRPSIALCLASLLITGAQPALAQIATTSNLGKPAHLAPPHKLTTKKPPPKHPAAKKTPVVAPKHGPAPRHPVHPKMPVSLPPKEAAKPAPKPVPKLPPKPAIPPDQGQVTGLHIPRYASLKTDDINMRSGPGGRYPVLWTYKRRELPVKIEREFDVWRLVEDMDGVKGWVNGATLTGRRTFVITGTDPRTVHADASDDSEAVAVLKPGVVGRIKSCDANASWCQVTAAGYRGWLPRTAFWGADPGEVVAP